MLAHMVFLIWWIASYVDYKQKHPGCKKSARPIRSSIASRQVQPKTLAVTIHWTGILDWTFFPFYSGSLPVDWLLELLVVNEIIISNSVIVVTTRTLINTNIASK